MSCVIRIETADAARRAAATALALRAGLLIVSDDSDVGGEAGLTLAMRDDGWELRDADGRRGRGLRIDFTHLAQRGRGGANLSRRQPLARAIGRDARRVIDATAGLGQDAALLAAMGFWVTAIERNTILAAMLDDALRQAAADAAMARMLLDRLRIVQADACTVLAQQTELADCVYLDPMFPPKRKASALARKEIRLVRALVGDDDDAGELLAVARQVARRVAVKRPTYAPPLHDDVTATIVSKLVRYDVYVRA